ncbi:MAG: EpsI family protein [Armatimonadota bacterium]|nr:EpsI family protein [bacterium]MDW8320583.1 EpsI family protein [Armatimonadota bacterium]
MATIETTITNPTKRMVRNLWILLALSVATAAVVLAIQPGQGRAIADISEERIPLQIGEWHGTRYEMGAMVFQALRPDAIISRTYIHSSGKHLDFVLLAGTHADAFHNPHLCFPDQGWKIQDERSLELHIPGVASPVKARLMQVDNNGRKATVVYWYRAPFGTTSSVAVARVQTYTARIVGMSRQQTFFIRFIVPSSQDVQKDIATVQQFAGELFSVLKQTLPEVI